jgi:hypothetical protein
VAKFVVAPSIQTATPVGGLVAIGDLASGDVATFGEESVEICIDHLGRPTATDATETARSRWIAESTSPGMFDVIGTWFEDDGIAQGTLASGASENYLLLTSSHLRGSVQVGGHLRAHSGMQKIGPAEVYTFAIPLIEIELVDGNKRDIAVAGATEGLLLKWVRASDPHWNKVKGGGLWHKDNASFAQALVEETIAAKLQHPQDVVRASAEAAARTDKSRAFTKGQRTTFEFAVPTEP